MKPPPRGSARRRTRTAVRRLVFEWMEPRLNLALIVPAFSSLPGADHTIYLDFDGHVTTGTSWNSAYGVTSINSPAYSTDADVANFSASEFANIEKVWKRVAEDFAPFQVNVTTVEPPIADLQKSGSGDTKWGIRVVTTKDVAFNCGCGGIAYYDSFIWSSDTPVFVFNTGEIGVAEAASHEVGHSLGLSHDGTSSVTYYQGHGSGETSWAPIMGVGYYKNVTHFDKGEYYGSNNSGAGANRNRGPDDLHVMTTYFGFGYKADDHGNSSLTASSLSVFGSTITANGLITTRTDVDYFQFSTGAGTVTLDILPAALGPNLDIAATLYNSAGQVVAASNPAATLKATITATLTAGQYFLAIDGAGVGTPDANPPSGYSDYASIGPYSIAGTITPISGDVLEIVASDASKNEGNSGAATFTFTVNRAGDTSGTSTIDYVVNGSGPAPATEVDFVGGTLPGGALTFVPGQLSQTISISVQGDTTAESNEGFTVSLANPGPSTSISIGSANGTIVNDDVPPGPPTLSISATDAVKAEGTGSSPTPFVFTITRSGSVSAAASVRYSLSGTGNRKASGSDFVGGFPKDVVVSFAPFQTTADVVLNVVADSSNEKNETFKVTLSNPSGTSIATSSATGSILNDDASGTRADDEIGDADDAAKIAVADPLWAFIPAQYLTEEQLAIPVVTWINNVPYLGELPHDHSHDHHFDAFDAQDGFYSDELDVENQEPLMALDSLVFFEELTSSGIERSEIRGSSLGSKQVVERERATVEVAAAYSTGIRFRSSVLEDSALRETECCVDTLSLDEVFENWLSNNSAEEA